MSVQGNMMSARTFAVPGTERCDICGNLLTDQKFGPYGYRIESERVPVMHHEYCERDYQARMRNAQEHIAMCHLENCDRVPKPTRWIDGDSK